MDIKDILYEKAYNKRGFVENISKHIKDNKLVQRKIAKDLGFHPQNLNAFLKGRLAMSTDKIKKLTDYINM